MLERAQRTLKRKVRYSGLGIHFGRSATLTLEPAEENTGVVFCRSDLGSCLIPALLENVCNTGRSTSIASDGAVVSTVEHLMAALLAHRIDNVRVHCSHEEVPIGDGSSQVFVHLINEAGIQEQQAPVAVARLKEAVYYQTQDSLLAAFPADELKISYTLHYPHSPTIGIQYRSFVITGDSFCKEIAPCRTFALYNELCFLMSRGLIKGGCLGNALVFKDDGVISCGKLRFPDEPVRHKILDLIGDLSLIGRPFEAHIVAIGSGHASNVAFGRKILKALQGNG